MVYEFGHQGSTAGRSGPPNMCSHTAYFRTRPIGGPPKPDFWLTTPKPPGKFWAVYALLLTKDWCEPALYIGSGTSAHGGYELRVAHYHDKKHSCIPRFVRLLYDKGYDLAHIGLFCWAPMPHVTIVPRARRRFVAIEAVLRIFSTLPFALAWTVFGLVW